MSLTVGGDASFPDARYALNDLYPSGLPDVLTFVLFTKDNAVSGGGIPHLAHLYNPLNINQLVGIARRGAYYRTTTGSTSLEFTSNDAIFDSFQQIAVEFNATTTSTNVKVRYNDVVGSSSALVPPDTAFLLTTVRANYKDFVIFERFAFNSERQKDIHIANIALFEGALTDAELSEIAKDKNITDPKFQTGGRTCAHYWSFIDDWGSGDIVDEGTNPVNLTQPFPASWEYSDENPISPIAIEDTVITGFGNTLFIASTLAGTLYCIRQTAGSTPPADAAAVINATVGGDILEVVSATATVPTFAGDALEFTTGDSFTTYDYYYALDGAVQTLGAAGITATTSGFVQNTELLQDVDGVAFPDNQVRWAWFDGTEPDSFAAPSDVGFEPINGGQYSFSLPDSTLNQGEEGTLILDYKDGGVGGKRSELKYVMQVQ